MNTSTKRHHSRLPLFGAADFGSRQSFPAWIDTDDSRAGRLLSPVMPRVRDSLTLRCVFSRTANFFAPESLHARRAH
ncbi:MAG TPA: hypothetical protein VK785_07785 [Opitutaceae bacterium]|nr:hypothetical protein [Opitutaceae bacterium]